MITDYQNGDDNQVLQRHNTVMKCGEEATEMKRTIMKEVAEVGAVLLSRDDFIRLSAEINTIADYCGGASYRLSELAKRKWEADKKILKDMESLGEASLDCVLRLKGTILSLKYGGAKVLEAAKKVESAERVSDAIYRKVDLRIISAKMKLPVMFLLREVSQFLEDIADISEDAADTAKILAITT